jgi:UDP-3-O-[3-hydroxymyristoyl] N-acetylglucosamine deacetylase
MLEVKQVHAHSAFVNEVVLSTGLENQGVKDIYN